MQNIIVITGPPGSGKSTIASNLAESIERGVVISVDEIRHMVKSAYENPWAQNEEAKKQLTLSVKNTCDLATNFIKEGFVVIIDDVVLSDELQEAYKKFMGEKIRFFVLLPSEEVLMKRDSLRSPEAVMGERAKQLHKKFSLKKHPVNWEIIDNSNQTPKETTNYILKKLNLLPKTN